MTGDAGEPYQQTPVLEQPDVAALDQPSLSRTAECSPRKTAVRLVKVRRAAQITLPREIQQAAGLKEGDFLEAEVTAAGMILLRPVGTGDREPSAAEEAEILAVVDQEREAYAAERRR